MYMRQKIIIEYIPNVFTFGACPYFISYPPPSQHNSIIFSLIKFFLATKEKGLKSTHTYNVINKGHRLNYPPSPPHPLMMRNANTDTSILPVIWWNTVYKHIQWKKMTGQKRNVVMGYNPIRKTPQKGLRIEHWKLIKQEQT